MKAQLPGSESRLGWHGRGYLPHFEGGELAQFITFRLHDSLPRDVVIRWKEELKLQPSLEVQSLMRKRVEVYLDQGHGDCYLRNPHIANVVQRALLFHDQIKYRLSAWVIMPNHVHLLCTPLAGHSLADIMHSIKSFTASEANKMLNRKGRFWQKEYFDRYIRNSRQFGRAVTYLENNPVKGNLCYKAEDWPFSSAALRTK
ncbi:MAG TPA: transposase [Pyrinomonadaceae bacterium]|nr:transposase [Pyrinomonadaceae bacterium]